MTCKFKVVTTRKPHKCHGCREVIQAGSRVEKQTVFHPSEGVYSLYTCDPCVRISSYYDADHEGYPEGFVKDMMSDEGFKGTPVEYLAYLRDNSKPISEYL